MRHFSPLPLSGIILAGAAYVVIAMAVGMAEAQLQGFYPFEGDANDSSGKGNHATLVGEIGFDPGYLLPESVEHADPFLGLRRYAEMRGGSI